MTLEDAGFAHAVKEALDTLGTSLLFRSDQFVSAVMDLYDPDSREAIVLYLHGGNDLLRPYADATVECTTQALEAVAHRTTHWLHDARCVAQKDADAVAWGIARGIAAHLGIRAPQSDRATNAVEMPLFVLPNPNSSERYLTNAPAVTNDLSSGTRGLMPSQPPSNVGSAKAGWNTGVLTSREKWAEATPTRRPRQKPRIYGKMVVFAVLVCLAVFIALYVNSLHRNTAVPSAADVKVEEPIVEVREGISEYSWRELKEIAYAIANASDDGTGLEIAKEYNLVDEDGKLRGATKRVTLTDGTQGEVRILGFRHDELADGDISGISFEFADLPTSHHMNTDSISTGGWEASEMRTWLNSEFYDLLPEDLRDCLEAASKLTNNVGGEIWRPYYAPGGDIMHDYPQMTSSTTDKLWLLSAREMYGMLSDEFESINAIFRHPYIEILNAEGTQYQLYADQGTSVADYGFCAKEGDSAWACYEDGDPGWYWFLRSPGDWEGCFLGINENGIVGDHSSSIVEGVSPGFCF